MGAFLSLSGRKWVSHSKSLAVSGAECLAAHRSQSVWFEGVYLWIPLRGFVAQGQGYADLSRALIILNKLSLVHPDTVVQNREEAKLVLKASSLTTA